MLPVGTFLCANEINELPQLLNIFYGDMSIIGLRPLISQTFAAYSEATQSIITRVRLWPIRVGSIIFRDEEY